MKKLIFVFFIATIVSLSVNATDLTKKDVLGNWKYKVEMPDGNLTGVLKIMLKDDKLAGEVNDDQGYVFQLLKIEIAGEELLFELQPDYEVLKAKAKMVEGKMVGTVKMNGQDLKLVAEK
jgi:hypothetical protein